MDTVIQQLNAGAGLIIPEIILLATMCVAFLIGPFLVSESGQTEAGLRHRWGFMTLTALLAAGIVWWTTGPQEMTNGPFRSDQLLWFVRGIVLAFGVLLTLLLRNQTLDGQSAEAHACLLAILAGTSLTVAANDLVSLFLGLELVSIPTYVLLYLSSGARQNREATLKYFLLSIFSSAVLLYGLSWLFGACGTTNLAGIRLVLENNAVATNSHAASSHMVALATAFLFAGLGFRITAVPFHFYAPDVFQGVSASSAAMLSLVPKVVGFAALVRLLPVLSGVLGSGWVPQGNLQMLLTIVAILTMSVGNLMALRQQHLYRLLAYSSISHAGYMLVGLASGNSITSNGGLNALWFYLVAYGVATVGIFALISAASTSRRIEWNADLAGLSRTQPQLALLMAICVFGLVGLPPTAGFLGKLSLFLAAWSAPTGTGRVLASVLAVNAVIAAWYYLKLIGVMYLDTPREPAVSPSTQALNPTEQPTDPHARFAGIVCTVLTIGLFLSPQWLWTASTKANTAVVPKTQTTPTVSLSIPE